MTLPRTERLKLLGLWPLWQLRGAAPPPDDAHDVETTVAAVETIQSAPLPPPFTPDPRPAKATTSHEPAPHEPVPHSPRGPRPFLAALQSSMHATEAQRPAASKDTLPPKPDQKNTPAEISVQHPDVANLDWLQLREAVESCTRCNLHAARNQAVFGVGAPQADWLFVGEAPGAEEDRRGEPFVGQAGQLLDAMLAAIQLDRQQNLYITNVLKSRPPGNQDPKPEQVAACIPFLKRQIELVKPKLIVALGRFAAQTLLDCDTSISKLRGQVHNYHGIPLVVTYHPAYLLRNLPDKAKVWEDLCLAKRTMQARAQPANPG